MIRLYVNGRLDEIDLCCAHPIDCLYCITDWLKSQVVCHLFAIIKNKQYSVENRDMKKP